MFEGYGPIFSHVACSREKSELKFKARLKNPVNLHFLTVATKWILKTSVEVAILSKRTCSLLGSELS